MNPDRSAGLQDSEEWYRRLLKTMNEGFTIRDENTLFTYVNDKFCEMLGYTREELIGRKIEDFIARTDLAVINKQLEKRKRGTRSTYELTWIRKNGRKLCTIMSAAPLFDDAGNFRGGFGAMTDITPRKLAEKKLITYQSKLKSMASELSLAEERERRRIAAELHDRIGQALAMAKIRIGALMESTSSPGKVAELDEIRELVEQTIRDTRSLTVELSPPILYELGFEAAVEWFTEHIQERYAIETQFEDDSHPKPLDEDVRVLLFKVVKELMFNIVKHAHARKARVTIRKKNAGILITVADDGVGFETHESMSQIGQNKGFGLFSISERLDHLGGHFKINSGPGRGTHATISAPLKDPKA
jgi:PAS domain S-box-containing protein